MPDNSTLPLCDRVHALVKIILPVMLLAFASPFASGGILIKPKDVSEALMQDRKPRDARLSHDHLHALPAALLEHWSGLAVPACGSVRDKKTRALSIGVGSFQSPVFPSLRTNTDIDYVQKALASREIADIRVLRNEEATLANIENAMTRLLEDSQCGDRLLLSWSGMGAQIHHGNFGSQGFAGLSAEPLSIMAAHDASGACAETGEPCTGWLSAHDLADFVSAARNTGVEVLLFVDACHGIDLADSSRKAVWMLPLADPGMFQLRSDAADFAAFFAATPDSYAMEVAVPGATDEWIGAFPWLGPPHCKMLLCEHREAWQMALTRP